MRRVFFKPIIMKVGSQRRGTKGFIDMATDIEMIARKHSLILHDKIMNELRPSMQSYIINTSFQKRFTMKIHETNLVFVKYEQVEAVLDSMRDPYQTEPEMQPQMTQPKPYAKYGILVQV